MLQVWVVESISWLKKTHYYSLTNDGLLKPQSRRKQPRMWESNEASKLNIGKMTTTLWKKSNDNISCGFVKNRLDSIISAGKVAPGMMKSWG
jgi:hypothetical protein